MVPLVRDGSFFRSVGPVLCPLLGAEVPVTVDTDGAEVQSDQLRALAGFLAIPGSERDSLTGRLFDDYRAVRDAIGEGPEIDGPERVWEFVRWTTILIPQQGPTGSRFVFVQGDPAWEEEHGVELLFRDERLLRLDRASGAFLSTCFWSWT
ncbi:unnamed protein product [Gemmataceae bacterium]|nr:unnamed protein product [Gemmataceae bacterium]VTU02196.1 unnamed protein product [Gemmataceae bacterium]